MNPFRSLRFLGLAAMLLAPAMLVEVARHDFQRVLNEDTDPVGALLYGLFSLGWLAAMIGLHRLRAAGAGRLGRLVTAAPIATVSLAIGQTFMDLADVPVDHPAYLVTDLAWPLSMLLTFAVAVGALVARRLPLWGRLALAFCGASLPVALVGAMFGEEMSGWIFAWHTAVGWFLLGLAVFRGGARSARLPAAGAPLAGAIR